MKEHGINTLNNFIGGWYSTNIETCDKIINYHKNSNNKNAGLSSGSVDVSRKDSVDVVLSDTNLIDEYCHYILRPATVSYIEKYEYANDISPWGLTENINIQYYKPPGGGYKEWHTERMSGMDPYTKRHLVFMTYLNDVTDCGETEFYYQKLKIKPEKGLTLIWGSDWTFTHRGLISPSQEKYIITGWYSFL